jgi:Tfp pilus assembly protein PilP
MRRRKDSPLAQQLEVQCGDDEKDIRPAPSRLKDHLEFYSLHFIGRNLIPGAVIETTALTRAKV